MSVGHMGPGEDVAPAGGGVTRWRFSEVLRVGVLYIALHLALSAVVALLAAVTGHDRPPSDYYLPTTPGQVALSLARSAATLAAIAAVARSKGGVRQALGLRLPSRRWRIVTLAIAAVFLGAKLAFALAIRATVGGGDGLSVGALAGLILTVGVVTPIVEEALYRGVLYGWLQGLLGRHLGILASAAIFAIEHHGLALGSVPVSFVLGALFAWLYHRSHSLWPSVIVHGASNIGSLLSLARDAL